MRAWDGVCVSEWIDCTACSWHEVARRRYGAESRLDSNFGRDLELRAGTVGVRATLGTLLLLLDQKTQECVCRLWFCFVGSSYLKIDVT
eukprot:818492-Pleurochrysis_carterae.AAC.2